MIQVNSFVVIVGIREGLKRVESYKLTTVISFASLQKGTGHSRSLMMGGGSLTLLLEI